MEAFNCALTIFKLECKQIYSESFAALSTRVAEYTNCISAEVLDSPNMCEGYDTKHTDARAPVMLELRGMRSTPLLPSIPVLLWSGVIANDRVLSMGLVEVFDI